MSRATLWRPAAEKPIIPVRPELSIASSTLPTDPSAFAMSDSRDARTRILCEASLFEGSHVRSRTASR